MDDWLESKIGCSFFDILELGVELGVWQKALPSFDTIICLIEEWPDMPKDFSLSLIDFYFFDCLDNYPIEIGVSLILGAIFF